MKAFEEVVRGIRKKYGIYRSLALSQILGKANTLIQDMFFGGIHRRLNGTIEVSLSARFRTVPEEYEPLAFRVVETILRPGSLAVDVGANIGLYTLSMAKLVSPHGKVVSFEPASESFAALLDHIRRNNLRELVEAHKLVVGNKCGNCVFIEDGVRGTNRVGGSRSQGKGAKAVERKMVTLDQIFAGGDLLPDLIKIDVEGYEMSVLEGAQRTLAKRRCPVLCELHPGYWRTMNFNPDNLLKFTRDLGYQMFEVSGAPCSDLPLDHDHEKMVLLR